MATNDITNLTKNTDETVLLVSETGYNTADYRNAYMDQLNDTYSDNSYIAAKINVISKKDSSEPVLEYRPVRGDYEPSLVEVNETILDTAADIITLDNFISNLTAKYTNLIYTSQVKMSEINKSILKEYERLSDINLICSAYTNLNNVITLTDKNFSGNFNYDSSTNSFSASSVIEKASLTVKSISGNGIEGNEYVYNNEKNSIMKDVFDASDRNSITDDSKLTKYEYSRLFGTNDNNAAINNLLNNDNRDIVFTIEIEADNKIDTIKIDSDNKSLFVKNVLISRDEGQSYESCLNRYRELTKRYNEKTLSNTDSSNVICFPATTHVKLVLETGDIDTENSIGFLDKKTKTEVSNAVDDSGNAITITKTTTEDIITVIPGAYRKYLSINQLVGFFNNYEEGSSIFSTGDLISDNEKKSIGIFATEYIPDTFPSGKDYIKYYLTINGEQYRVYPINSNENGIKIISFNNYNTYSPDSLSYISETIKSASLQIEITPYSGYGSPYISNLKICYGD